MADEIIVKVRADVDGFKSDMDEAKKIGNSAIQEIEKNSIDLKVDTKSTESLRTQMRKAQQEVAELSLKFGATSKAAVEAAKRASELKDRIADAKALTDAFNPDAKFKALSGSLQGVVGGFTAVQGAIGAFGTKSEEVEQALLKVNSAMALSQGLQSVGESVDSFKNLGTVIKSTTAFQFLYNAATATATAVQTAFGVATTATSTGFKVLRGAIMATGIGALVVGLGLVISNFDAISNWISKSPLGGFASSVGNLVQKFTDLVGITSESERQFSAMEKMGKMRNDMIGRQIKLLSAQGGKESEIAKLQKESTQNEINTLLKKVDKKGKLYGEDAKNYLDLQNNLAVIDATESKRKNDEAIKASEKSKENSKKEKDRRDKEKQELLDAEIRYQKSLEKSRVEQFEKDAKIQQDAFDATLTAQQLEERAVKDKYFQQIEEAKNYNETYKNDLTKSQIDIIILEQKKVDELTAINDKYLKERQDAEQKQKDYQKKLDEQSAENFKKERDKEIALIKEKFDRINEFASNGILLQIGLNPQDINRLSASIKSITDKIAEGKPIDATQVAEAAGSAYFAVSNAISNAQKEKTAQELEQLKAQQDEELRLAGDNEQKKELIRQKFAIKEREVKRRQAEADKRKAIMDATINTAVAVIKTFASLGFVAGIVPAAIMAALGAAQIALIAAQPIPKFAKGGAVPSSDIKGMIDGRPHASGGVLIEAEGNEFITRKAQAMKPENLGLLEAINMSDSERDAYLNAHYIKPALEAKENKAKESYQRSMIEAENNLIARISSNTLRNIHGELKNNTEAVKKLSKNNYSW
jgi:hypothetical protein